MNDNNPFTTTSTNLNGSKEKKRIHWLDIVRGVAFLMVIYSHLKFSDDSIMQFFSPVFLTSFFFVSGYLFKEKQKFLVVLEQRTRTLLIPFLIYGFILIGLSQIISFKEPIPLVDRIKSLLFQNGQNELIWFIAALYLYSLFFFWVDKVSKSDRILLVFGVLLFLFNSIYSLMKGPPLPWHLHTIGFGCFYMALGKWFKSSEKIIEKYMTPLYLFIGWMLYILLILFTKKTCSFAGDDTVIFSFTLTLIGLFIFIGICKNKIMNNKFFLFVGANSLFYFAFHGKVYSVLETATAKLYTENIIQETFTTNTIIAFTIVLLDALILIIPCKIMNKYFSFISGKNYKLW